jgi:hypothetical protein
MGEHDDELDAPRVRAEGGESREIGDVIRAGVETLAVVIQQGLHEIAQAVLRTGPDGRGLRRGPVSPTARTPRRRTAAGTGSAAG